MNKELEAFKRIKDITYDRTNLYGIEVFREDLDTIEIALKRLNYIDENKIFCISENYLQDIKKIKAFEIVNNKDIDIWLLKNCDYDNYCRIRTKCLETNVGSMVDCDKPAIPLPTKEEFDLLKEVLL